MAALQKIRDAGFTVSLVGGDSFEVIPASALLPEQRAFLKARKAEIVSELRGIQSLEDEPPQADFIRMQGSDENDDDFIDRVLTETWGNTKSRIVTCETCRYFESFYPHGKGGGTCSASVMPFGVCHWYSTLHDCDKHQRREAQLPKED